MVTACRDVHSTRHEPKQLAPEPQRGMLAAGGEQVVCGARHGIGRIGMGFGDDLADMESGDVWRMISCVSLFHALKQHPALPCRSIQLAKSCRMAAGSAYCWGSCTLNLKSFPKCSKSMTWETDELMLDDGGPCFSQRLQLILPYFKALVFNSRETRIQYGHFECVQHLCELGNCEVEAQAPDAVRAQF